MLAYCTNAQLTCNDSKLHCSPSVDNNNEKLDLAMNVITEIAHKCTNIRQIGPGRIFLHHPPPDAAGSVRGDGYPRRRTALHTCPSEDSGAHQTELQCGSPEHYMHSTTGLHAGGTELQKPKKLPAPMDELLERLAVHCSRARGALLEDDGGARPAGATAEVEGGRGGKGESRRWGGGSGGGG